MCVICVSKKHVPQPDAETLLTMFRNNPHGAGYMFARNGKVQIRKGFMKEAEFLQAVRAEKFTDEDVVIYHCRISTGGGIAPCFCHPYPLALDEEDMMKTEDEAIIGIAHNGIIHQPGCNGVKYSDTQQFIAQYLSWIFDEPDAIKDKGNRKLISELTLGSRLAIMDSKENIMLTGHWVCSDGLMYSNMSFLPRDEEYDWYFKYNR